MAMSEDIREKDEFEEGTSVELDDDQLEGDTRDFLGFDAQDLADSMGRINHEIARTVVRLFRLRHMMISCPLSILLVRPELGRF